MKYKCTKNFYFHDRMVFCKGNVYEGTKHSSEHNWINFFENETSSVFTLQNNNPDMNFYVYNTLKVYKPFTYGK